MTLNLSLPQDPFDIRPKITVIGVGGAGGNAVSNMIRSKLEGVEFMVANTDAQALQQSLCERRIQLGNTVTKGLGAGARPDIGRASAEEAVREIAEQLAGSNMAFITAGMGGGTGTGAAPVVAQIAREQGILTVGVVTKPFHFEGAHRMRLADSGIQELQQYVDTLIIIPNQNLFRIANEKTTFADAFKMADEVLYSGVRGVTDLMVMPGLINLDFADIRAVMSEMGKAMMGTGEATGENRAIAAAEAAISNPLLDEVSMKGARGVLINITGGMDMTLFEVDEAANRIRDEVDPDANIIFGSTFDQALDGKIRISVVATGIESIAQVQPRGNGMSSGLSIVARNPNPQPGSFAANPQSGGFTAEPRMDAVGSGSLAAQSVGVQAVNASARSATTMGHPQMGHTAMMTPTMGATALQAQPVRPILKDEMTALEVSVGQKQPERQPDRPSSSAFIAPPAMEARQQPMMAQPVVQPSVSASSLNLSARPAFEQPRAETVPAQALQNAMQQPTGQGEARKKAPTLFEKMTSRFAGQGKTAMPTRDAVPAGVQRPEPRVTRPEAPVQPSLNLDPTERLTQIRHEEETLDIPAFLRRQAN
ncbi:cell division protein FtsZ [Dongia rigui]|uniref:Cell division protein FtsZ n=1 Tax=Dongia rigui TaxID=940149 RepID=A0ABU5DV86_9PROT|nr:cell division protein FtsZ [Dongia rigui]MDY0871123.1 cell division protein FtsZ [Dongia rigui]